VNLSGTRDVPLGGMSHLRIQNLKCDKNLLNLPLDYYIVYSILLGKRMIF
jgi:hypothetical protein